MNPDDMKPSVNVYRTIPYNYHVTAASSVSSEIEEYSGYAFTTFLSGGEREYYEQELTKLREQIDDLKKTLFDLGWCEGNVML